MNMQHTVQLVTASPITKPGNNLTNGDTLPSKSVKWNTIDKDLAELHRVGAAIGVSGKIPSNNGTANNDAVENGVRYISLASPMNTSSSSSAELIVNNKDHSKAKVMQSLPIRPSLHKEKQIPGRYFPSPSFTEFQRDVLESRPTPRKVIKKLKPHNSNHKRLFPPSSPVKPDTTAEKSAWWLHETLESHGELFTVTQNRQYSIPATSIFHDGKNNAQITGSSIMLQEKITNQN